MELHFAKLQGAGNDFIIFDDFSREIDLTTEEVSWLCDRRFGIGADGVILVRPSERSECAAYMHYINADGTLAEMCGNGIRCFAKYLVDRGYVEAQGDSCVVETLAGKRPITFVVDRRERLVEATVDMGKPILKASNVPTTLEPNAETNDGKRFVKEAAIESPWGTFAFTCVSLGNPHAVCFLDNMESLPNDLFTHPAKKRLATLDVNQIGSFFESHAVFPAKANIEFAVVRKGSIHMRVFERGCGETLACGTGACATSVAAYLTGRAGRKNELSVRGGVLAIDWDERGHVMMTGPAVESFTGTVHLRRK